MGQMLYLCKGMELLSPYSSFFVRKYSSQVAIWPMVLGFVFALSWEERLRKFFGFLGKFANFQIFFVTGALFSVPLLKQSNLTVFVGLFSLVSLLITNQGNYELKGFCGEMSCLGWAQWKEFPFENVHSVGVGGSSSKEILGGVLAWTGKVEDKKALLQLGINDLKVLGYTETDKSLLVDSCVKNIREIVVHLHQQGFGDVFVLGVFPSSDIPLARKPFWSKEIEIARKEVNKRLLESSTEIPFHFIDCDFLSGDKDYYRDELHLSAEGYSVLSDYIGNYSFNLE